jgi:hypothetical protein
MSRYDAPRIGSDLLEQLAHTGEPVTGLGPAGGRDVRANRPVPSPN